MEGRREFWADYYAFYERLRADPEAWKQEMRERAAWDPVLVPRSELPDLD